MHVVCVFFASMLMLLPSLASAQSAIDNPPTNMTSNQSGATFIGGWHCDAETAAIRVRFTSSQGTLEAAAAGGTSRADTASVCGDANNGFGLSWNWNIFPDGLVTLEFLADDTVFATARVKVISLGGEFVSADASCTLSDFPQAGDTAVFQWSTGAQQLQLDSFNAQPRLQGLLGDWVITAYIEGLETPRDFSLTDIIETDGLKNVIGTGPSSDQIVVFRRADRPLFDDFPYDFLGLDVIGTDCLVLAFNQGNSNRLDGLMGRADATCRRLVGENLWPLFGKRIRSEP